MQDERLELKGMPLQTKQRQQESTLNDLLVCPICGKPPNFKWPEKLMEKFGFHDCKADVSIIIEVVMENRTIAEKWNEWAAN